MVRRKETARKSDWYAATPKRSRSDKARKHVSAVAAKTRSKRTTATKAVQERALAPSASTMKRQSDTTALIEKLGVMLDMNKLRLKDIAYEDASSGGIKTCEHGVNQTLSHLEAATALLTDHLAKERAHKTLGLCPEHDV